MSESQLQDDLFTLHSTDHVSVKTEFGIYLTDFRQKPTQSQAPVKIISIFSLDESISRESSMEISFYCLDFF